ncbi:MAG: Stp1/IreP family PP2C-type Ser/Thr phosphatase [Oscillospiraceae bacterium]|jgi:serine/threonine protein phosphatase PrpC|nr:Protein serine/threonine phosphatase PrpC, regulation of stationary phase [Ruminococcaceae bacterium BL-4]
MIRVCGKTDIGKVRSSNQDDCRFGLTSNGNLAWSVVCDGMGGANGGNVASNMAVESISEQYLHYFEETQKFTDNGLRDLMTSAAYNANTAIYERAAEDTQLSGMGTTLVTAIVYDGVAHIAHAGDSRAYLLDSDGIQQITTDHSMVQEMVDSGDLTLQQAKNHPQKNIITRALGVEDQIQTDYCEITLPQDWYLLILCTDGFSNCVEPEVLIDFAKKFQGQDLADQLIEEANKNGGGDNITVSIIEN